MSILAFCTSSSFSFILHSFPSFFTPLSSILQIFIFCFDCSSDTDTTLNNVTVLYLKSEKSSFMSFWIGANVISSKILIWFPDLISQGFLQGLLGSLHWGFLWLEQFPEGLCWFFYKDRFIFYLRDRTSSHTSRFQGKNF